MKTKYFNLKSHYGTETVDSLSLDEFCEWDEIKHLPESQQRKAYSKELNRLLCEYHLSGMPVYLSQRACK